MRPSVPAEDQNIWGPIVIEGHLMKVLLISWPKPKIRCNKLGGHWPPDTSCPPIPSALDRGSATESLTLVGISRCTH